MASSNRSLPRQILINMYWKLPFRCLVGPTSTPSNYPRDYIVEHAKYRLGAIHRTLEQGDRFTRKQMKEFKAETRWHARTLVDAKVMTAKQGAKVAWRGKGAAP